MKIELVPLQYVHAVWPDVERHLTRSVEYSHGEYTIEQVRAALASGGWVLLVATDGGVLHGAMAIEIYNRPNHRVAFIKAVGGRNILNVDTFQQMCAFFKRNGATSVECATRPSMQRLLERIGMAEKYRIMGLAL